MRNSKHLRRAGSIAAAAVVMALAAPALAGAATYGGTFEGGGTVNLKTVKTNGKIVGVKDFGWKSLPTECTQGPFSYSGGLPFSLDVRNRAFAIKATGVGVVQAVTGKFTNHRRKASGTLNVYGALGLGHSNCSTGLLQWSASRR
jgi:hypothetical protein